MSLQQQITDDWKAAMKARDTQKKDVLAMMRTELKNRAIADRAAGSGGTEVDDKTALDVFTKMGKQRRDSITQYEAGGREDLAEKERYELEVIQSYLPAQLSEAEIEAEVAAIIEAAGASSMKDMGKVMGPAMGKMKGRADGSKVQAVVKRLLAGG